MIVPAVAELRSAHARAQDEENTAIVTQAREEPVFGTLLSGVPADIRDVSFPSAVRGYERGAVNEYVRRVNRVIAELEVSRSPESAVKHALDRVGEQASGVLARAREVADELTSTALTEAEHATRRSKVEVSEVVESAQERARELQEDAQRRAEEMLERAREEAAKRLQGAEQHARVAQQKGEEHLLALHADIAIAKDARGNLLDDLRRTAAELEELASSMIARTPAERGAQQHAEEPAPAMPAPAERGAPPAGDEPTQAMAAHAAPSPAQQREGSPSARPLVPPAPPTSARNGAGGRENDGDGDRRPARASREASKSTGRPRATRKS